MDQTSEYYTRIDTFIGFQVLVIDTDDLLWPKLLSESGYRCRIKRMYKNPDSGCTALFLKTEKAAEKELDRIGRRIDFLHAANGNRDFPEKRREYIRILNENRATTSERKEKP